MFSPRRKFEYCLLDAMYNFYYMDAGVLKKQPLTSFIGGNKPFYLPQHPDGWQNIQISFATNNQYWMLNRSFSVPLNFITDGSEIIRNLRYKGKGFSEMVYILILRKNHNSSVYEAEYYGQLDLSKASDDPLRGITVNTLEGGLLSFFNTNANTTYDIPCDESVMDAVRVLNDGMTLSEKFNYQFINSQLHGTNSLPVFSSPLVFINNEGDNIGIVKNDTPSETFANQTDLLASESYILYSIYGITINIVGILNVVFAGPLGTLKVVFVTSLGQTFTKYNATVINTGNVQVDLTQTITLAANEKLFFYIELNPSLITLNATPAATNFSISFLSRNTTTELFTRRAVSVGQSLIDKMTNTTGVYFFQSNFLTTNNHVVLTCGDAIRQTAHSVVPVYYMSMSFQDFFISYSADYDLGVKIVGNTLYVEPKADLNNIAGGQIFDLGEVAALTIECAEDKLCNVLNCGYPDQSYDQNAGKYEYNSTQSYGLPTTASKTVLDITAKFRGDARGIEAIRGALLNKDTTDNSGDKQVFMIDISASPISQAFAATKQTPQTYTGQNWINFDFIAGNNFIASNDFIYFYYNQDYQKVDIQVSLRVDNAGNEIQVLLFKNGQSIAIYQGTDTDGVFNIVLSASNITLAYNDNFEVRIIPFDLSAQTYTVNGANLNVTFLVPVYPLYRDNYTALSGVIDNTIYNVRLSPHRQLLAHAGYLKSVFYQQQTDQIIFNTGAKNILLSTTISGVTITENSNETIGNMPGAAYFLPYIFKFTTKIPYTFAQTMALLNAGYFKFSFNGITLYGLPIGSMTAKPATNEPQQWSVLAAPNNNLTSFLLLDEFAITIQTNDNLMYISAYNPVQFVKYNYSVPAKYQYKDLYDDWSFQRFQNFYAKPFYFQKWQTSDTINLQFLTSGEGQLQLFIYDDKGKQYSTTPLNIVSNSAVPTPFVLQQISFTLPEGIYLFVIKNGAGVNLAVSEWQSVKVFQRNTHLYEYSSSYNVRNTFFNSWGTVSVRVEGQIMPADPDSDFTEFDDEEGDVTTVHDNPRQIQKLYIGDNLGIPDYLAMKLNLITLLDTLLIEGIAYSRDKDAKVTNVGFRPGYPWSQYTLIIRKTINELGLMVITDQDVTDNLATSFMIDQQAIGINAPGNINVTIQNT